MGDRYSAFRATEGVALASELGFLANTVVVDNLTASWLAIDAAGRYVPPFTYGATFPLGAGVQVAQAAWRTPPGIPAPTPSGGQAQLTFTSASLAPSNGQQVVVPSQQVVCQLSNLNGATAWTPGGGTVSLSPATNPTVVTFNSNALASGSFSFNAAIPAGANGIIITGLIGYSSGGVTQPAASLSVVGVQSNTRYLVTTGSQPTPPFFAVIASAEDSSVLITFGISNGGGGNSVSGSFEVVATFGTTTVAVEGGANPITVVVNPATLPLQTTDPGTQSVIGTSGVNAAQTVTLSPLLGAAIHIYSITVSWSGATAGAPNVDLVNNSAVVVWQAISTSQAGGKSAYHYPFMGGGINMGIGLGCTINVSASGAAGIASVVAVAYSYLPF